jgi:hypothetical protein
MEQFIGGAFLIAWFVFWAWMLATRPDTVFKFNQMGQDNMGRAARGLGRATLFGLKHLRK